MIEGEVERVENSSVRGWALSPDDAEDRLLIEAFVRGRLRGSTSADRAAPAAPIAVNGHAGHGFLIEFARQLSDPDLAELEIYATAASGERTRIRANGNAIRQTNGPSREIAMLRRGGATVGAAARHAPPAANAAADPGPAAVAAPAEERMRAFLRGQAEARAAFEAALRDLAAALPATATRDDEDGLRYEAAAHEAERLRARLAAAQEALDGASAALHVAEDVTRYMAAGLRELSALRLAEVDATGAAAAAAAVAQFSPVDDDPDEAAPEFPEYWLPDPLREYIIERYGDDAVPFVREMMAIIARHDEDRAGFANSYDCRALLRQLRAAAAAPAAPDAAEPIDVSIVMPVYNGLVYTLTCLVSLFAMPTRYRFEVIVGDNASDDGTGAAVPAIGGRVRYIRHPENLGFLLNCNVSGIAARGRWIVLLNNDVIILPGWLDELIDTFGRDETVGYVGSKLLNSDGSLQEAGGIFWSDGSAWNYGRGQNPRLPEFNYAKEADYCSGAAIALPKAVWDRMGGFDLHYVPAYCEDSDLAFRVRAAGLRTLYQPFAEIIHHEGKTHGRDTTSGIKAYQVVNGRKLYERWSAALHEQHFPNGEQVFLARDRSRGRPHILFVDHYVPQWDRDAGSRTIFSYLRLFLEHGFQISFWPDNLYHDPVYAPLLQKMGVEVIYSRYYVGRFDAWIAENGKYFDYIFLSRAATSKDYIDGVRAYSNGSTIYYGHDLPWRRLEVQYEVTKEAKLVDEIQELRITEDLISQKCDVLCYPAAEECEIVRNRFPGKTVIEFPINYFEQASLDETAGRVGSRGRDRFHLLFVGGFQHPPNVDAVLWFVQEVLPRLWRRDRRFRFTIVGSNMPEDVASLAADRIIAAGQVSDDALQELYRTVGSVVVPLRFGAGVKGKVIESFAHGVPTVATSIGVQGIEDAEELAFVADAPDDFAEQIIRATRDRDSATRKARAALAFLARRYSRDAVRQLLSQVVKEFRD
jgi:GT2 family glycosyltransferase